jgi:RHS repeat-associated protein
MDRQLFYASPAETNCGDAQANNGNIGYILEGVGSGSSQTFAYDGLNRLTQAYSVNRPAATAYNQAFNYDSFGNMTLVDQLHMPLSYGIDPATNRLTLNGDVNIGDLRYNANGTLAISPNGIGGYHTYMWTGEGYLRGIDGYGTGSYLYDSMGERTLAVYNNTGAYEYVYLNGQTMADLDLPSGIWTDYIYANGQKIAQVKNADSPVHISGDNCAACGGTSSYVMLTSGAGYIIQSGDVLHFSQFNVAPAVGGLILQFADGSATSGTIAQDQYGEQINCSSTSGQTVDRTIDLSAYAGKVLVDTLLVDDVCSPAGHFDLYFNDIAITSLGGVTTTIYTPRAGQVFNMVQSSAWPGTVSNMRAVAEANSYAPAPGVHYYLADQVGTTQMELSASGWPVWQGYFTPFGQEIQNGAEQIVPGPVTADGTNNRYKFTGKERDSESGLDYFGARYYGSSMGRFMSPDPIKITDERLLNPANTLNLYSYAANNPLKYVDLDGQDITYFYDPGGVAGHAVLFAYNEQTGDSALESFGPEKSRPENPGVSNFDMNLFSSAQGLRDNYASLTIQTSPELAQQVIDYIRANPDPCSKGCDAKTRN